MTAAPRVTPPLPPTPCLSGEMGGGAAAGMRARAVCRRVCGLQGCGWRGGQRRAQRVTAIYYARPGA